MRALLIILVAVSCSWAGASEKLSDYEVYGSCPDQPQEPDDDTFGGGTVPWPWSLQCPLEWENIEGFWRVQEDVRVEATYYEFNVVRERESGDLNLIINEYNINDELVSRGFGVSQKGQQTIRAAMRYLDDVKREAAGHWLYVSNFALESQGQVLLPSTACQTAEIFTAVKVIPFGKVDSAREDAMVIKKFKGRKTR